MRSESNMGDTLREFSVRAHGPGEFLVTIKVETLPMSCDESPQTACWMFMIKDDVFLELVTDMRYTPVVTDSPWDLVARVPPRVTGGSVEVKLVADLKEMGDQSLMRFWWE